MSLQYNIKKTVKLLLTLY